MQYAVAPVGIGGERHFATAAERARHHPLSLDSRRRRFMVQRREPRGEIVAAGADLDTQRALPCGRQADFDRQTGTNP
jgi:hypothetical protein